MHYTFCYEPNLLPKKIQKSNWKLMLPHADASDDLKALYNLNEDPYELKNLLGSHPESKNYTSKVAELESCFREWTKRTAQNKEHD